MRNITNDYRESQVLDLGTAEYRGPFLVTQTGVNPADRIPKTKMFVLRPDGCWVDFNAYVCEGKPELMDELVFPTMADVIHKFSTLLGKPRILDLPVNEEGLKAWIDKQKHGNPLEAAKAWAIEYRARRRAHERDVTGFG